MRKSPAPATRKNTRTASGKAAGRPAAKRTYWAHWTKCPRCGGQFVYKDRPCWSCFPACTVESLPGQAVSHTCHALHWFKNAPENPHHRELFAAHPHLAGRFEAAARDIEAVARGLADEIAAAVKG